MWPTLVVIFLLLFVTVLFIFGFFRGCVSNWIRRSVAAGRYDERAERWLGRTIGVLEWPWNPWLVFMSLLLALVIGASVSIFTGSSPEGGVVWFFGLCSALGLAVGLMVLSNVPKQIRDMRTFLREAIRVLEEYREGEDLLILLPAPNPGQKAALIVEDQTAARRGGTRTEAQEIADLHNEFWTRLMRIIDKKHEERRIQIAILAFDKKSMKKYKVSPHHVKDIKKRKWLLPPGEKNGAAEDPLNPLFDFARRFIADVDPVGSDPPYLKARYLSELHDRVSVLLTKNITLHHLHPSEFQRGDRAEAPVPLAILCTEGRAYLGTHTFRAGPKGVCYTELSVRGEAVSERTHVESVKRVFDLAVKAMTARERQHTHKKP